MDVIMPIMNGREAYLKIREQHPDARVIFMSGYTADVIQHKGLVADGLNFLHKPVSKQQLLKKVRDVLDAGKPEEKPSDSTADG
jgi:two-component system NtrC family sensor kinase